jgi:hypothetical protein
MASNYKQSFKAFRAKAKYLPLVVAQDVAVQMATKLVILTPVDTTRAEANWAAALNTVPQDFDEAKRNSSGSRANLEKAKAIAKRMKLGDTFVVANSTPYIFRLNEGSSQQAPAGMTTLVVAAFQRMVERAAQKAKSKP